MPTIPSRFRVVRRLGQGGMGVVYEAEDTERGERVALKTLYALSPHGIYNLKREFRAVADVAHPNVVALHDLIVADDCCIFTMDLVQGVNILEHVRPGGLDEARLRAALPQLARGLQTLHGAGTIHRDIKPANVLVDEDGRVVLVDFGLAIATDRLEPVPSDYIVGTAPYMAPELIGPDKATTAADWYSLGAVLFEALTGARPFRGDALAILTEKQSVDAPRPSSIAPDVPADLDELCVALMQRDPAARPNASGVLDMLGVQRRAHTARPDRAAGLFIGRNDELDVLRRAIDPKRPGARAVVVVGESGIGKSSLIRTALARAPVANVVVLEGRCIENELVPYKAMDSLIDGLSAHWSAMDTDTAQRLLPSEPGLLRKLFPVLGRVPAMLHLSDTARPALAPHDLRAGGFAALRETVAAFAEQVPLVLFLDDLQWVDNDTMTLLADLLRPPDPPPVCVILAARPGGAAAIEDLVERCGIDTHELRLQPLAAAAALRASRELLRGGPAELAEHVARESGGSPFFLGELARHAVTTGSTSAEGLSLHTVLSERVARLDDSALAVLELLAVAREPISHRVLKAASQTSGGELARIERTLQRENFARSAGARSSDYVETYHDRIRELVYASIAPERRADLSFLLAVELERFQEGTAERLARHWREAGVPGRAAEHARRAADDALATLDCDRAARLYAMVLDLGDLEPGDRFDVMYARAGALSLAGRPVDAANGYLDAVEYAPDARRTELRRLAADEMMRGGYLSEGLAIMRPVLREFGVRAPATAGSAIASLLVRRAALRLRGYGWRARPRDRIQQRALDKVDLLNAVATGCNLSDYIRGAEFQARHVLEALRCGEPERLARALSYEVAHMAAVGRRRRALAIAERSRALASEFDTARARGYALFAGAIIDFYCDSQWRRALEALRRSEDEFRTQQSGGWEFDMLHAFSSFCAMYLGELPELAVRVPELVESAARRGARYDAVNLRTRLNVVWLAADEPATAEAQLERAIRSEMPTSERYLVQHFFAMHGAAELALYRGDARAARDFIDADLDRVQKSLVLKIRLVRIELSHLRGRVALALAARTDGSERDALLRECRGLIRELRRDREPIARACAQVLAAGYERLTGDRAAAEQMLRRAADTLEELDTHLLAAAARHQLGDPAGTAALRARGVKAPDRLAPVLIPAWD